MTNIRIHAMTLLAVCVFFSCMTEKNNNPTAIRDSGHLLCTQSRTMFVDGVPKELYTKYKDEYDDFLKRKNEIDFLVKRFGQRPLFARVIINDEIAFIRSFRDGNRIAEDTVEVDNGVVRTIMDAEFRQIFDCNSAASNLGTTIYQIGVQDTVSVLWIQNGDFYDLGEKYRVKYNSVGYLLELLKEGSSM